MINRLSSLFAAVVLPFVLFTGCNGGSQPVSPVSNDPTDPVPIISCGAISCTNPIPVPVPCSGGVVSSGGTCYPLPTPCSYGSCGSCGSEGSSGGCGPVPVSTGSNGSTGIASSLGQGTKDTGLQQADFEQSLMNAQAQNLVNRFAMSVSAATQLSQLANRIQAMAALGNGELTDADRAAVTQSALSIAGLTSDQVSAAVSQSAQGDNRATEALLETAAKNLGMPSSAALRDQLLPALGLSLN